MKLKIYSDRRFLPEGLKHEPIFFPFWGDPVTNDPDFPASASWSGGFEKYIDVGHSIFELTSLKDADLVIYPGNLEHVYGGRYQELSLELAEQARVAGKPIAGFFSGDCSEKDLPVPCDLVFRHSLYASTRGPRDFAYPAWSGDFAEKYLDGKLPIRQKRDKPVVGFCGFITQMDLKFYVKRLLYQGRKLVGGGFLPPRYIGHLLRKKALATLESSNLVETNFILRDKMGLFSQSLEMRENYRADYVRNMMDSDYLFCCRGYGNYSFRFFEILSCGKVPIFLNTDCVPPLDFKIDWKKYCVWVEESELPNIAEKIAEFHEQRSPQEFVELQYACRQLWEENIAPERFFAYLPQHLALSGINTSRKLQTS